MSAPIRHPELHDAAWLRRAHHTEGRSVQEIATLLGTQWVHVRDALVRAGVQVIKRLMPRARWKMSIAATRRSRGSGNVRWRGGRYIRSDGYVSIYAPKHPDADCDGRVLAHRLVAEKKLGRRLFSTEVVHHIDGNKLNNRPENIQVLSGHSEHRLLHVEEARRKRGADVEKQGKDIRAGSSKPATHGVSEGDGEAVKPS